jgi:hypothetical protein
VYVRVNKKKRAARRHRKVASVAFVAPGLRRIKEEKSPSYTSWYIKAYVTEHTP